MEQQLRWKAGADVTSYLTDKAFPPRIRLLRWLGRQSWLPKGHDYLLRLLCNPETTKHFFFEIDFFGQRYRGDLAHYLDWLVFCYGAAPLSELSLLKEIAVEFRRTKSKVITFFDVGANAGHHTLFMAPLVDSVVAFEPFPAVRDLLEEKIALNGLENVRVVPFALGQRDEVLAYYAGAGANSGVGSFLEPGSSSDLTPISLTIRHGDSAFDELALEKVAIMKVDVEGFEPFVFSGLRNRILADRPAILTEISEKSREGFINEIEFRKLFYEDACIAEVCGRNGRPFFLKHFNFSTSDEVLILPPEDANFIKDRISH